MRDNTAVVIAAIRNQGAKGIDRGSCPCRVSNLYLCLIAVKSYVIIAEFQDIGLSGGELKGDQA